MKKRNLSIAALGLFVFTSCSKMDVQQELAPSENVAAIVIPSASSQWHSVRQWEVSKEENTTAYNGIIADSTIDASIVNKGLVLVYGKNGTAIQALPYQEKGASWYYQVSEGSLLINCAIEGSELKSEQNFSYFIIAENQLTELKDKGYTKGDLLNLSHENAVSLLLK